MKKVLLFTVLLLLASCAKFKEIEEERSIEILESHFVYLEEMTSIYGREKCVDRIDCNYEYVIWFRLPDTLAPDDWLKHMVNEIKSKHDKTMKQNSRYEYEFNEPGNGYLRYVPNAGRYEAETVVAGQFMFE